MNRDDGPKSEQEPQIKVIDRRKFTREGEPIVPDSVSDSCTPSETKITPNDAPPPEEPKAVQAQTGGDLFGTHVMALGQLGMMHLGQIENPTTHQATDDLPAAKEVIDLLGMLHKKTQGNLTDEEKNLLDTWLYQLRMAFSRKAGKD